MGTDAGGGGDAPDGTGGFSTGTQRIDHPLAGLAGSDAGDLRHGRVPLGPRADYPADGVGTDAVLANESIDGGPAAVASGGMSVPDSAGRCRSDLAAVRGAHPRGGAGAADLL